MRIPLSILFLFVMETVHGDPYPRNESIDIRHYRFQLALNDTTNRIAGEAVVTIRLKKDITEFELDLAGVDSQNRGMLVQDVFMDGQVLKFSHQNDRLKIQWNGKGGDEKKITIRYAGIPGDGLIISKNKFGDRTFFGDNWPNLAHHWLPTIDHPYDKATCEFVVVAPDHYSVIATGAKVEESNLNKHRKLTHWKTSIVLPTKLMVIGVAEFAIDYSTEIDGIPLQSWVYPQNRDAGFSDYAIAGRILDYFQKNIAPYPYEKLANVQSTTMHGGMENAGNIFYYEKSVTGKGAIEGLVAHEVAHQWFGDSASEGDWFHVWLSEGFATYFANLYFERTYGRDRLMEEMKTDRRMVIDYAAISPTPVVNTSITDIKKVLNTNTYQKASWVLHMLRHEVGDQKFWEGIRQYYQLYQLSNALTDDFRRVMEKASGKDLKKFFDQWIFTAGHPRLAVTWKYDAGGKKLKVIVGQQQATLFDFPLEIGISTSNGSSAVQKVRISDRTQEFMFPAGQKPAFLSLDPEVWLLFDGNVKESGK